MKAAEMRNMSAGELRGRLFELKEELFNLRFQMATGQLDNTSRPGLVRREIARIETVMNEMDTENRE